MSRRRTRSATICFLLITIAIIGVSVYSTPLEQGEYGPMRSLYLRYEFEPVELNKLPVEFGIRDIVRLLGRISGELGLTKYNYKYVLSVPISPGGVGYVHAEVCLFASREASLEVWVLYANTYYEYKTKLTLSGGIVGYCASSNMSSTQLEEVLARILVHSNITLNDLRVIRANITYLYKPLSVLGFHFNGSIAFTIEGKIDPSTWSAITREGGYYNDWYFTLPSTSGDYTVILYSKRPFYEIEASVIKSEWSCGSRGLKGYSYLYLVNFSSIYNKRYEVEGLGVIEPVDAVYGLCVGGLIIDLVMPSNTSVRRVLEALEEAGSLRLYVYKVYNESNMIRLVPKRLFHALQAYRSRIWTFDLEACSVTKYDSELYKVPIVFPRIKYILPVVRVGGEYYAITCDFWGALLVYSKSYGVLLEAIPASELGSGVLPAYLCYTLSPYGADVILWSTSSPNTLGLKLAEVRGLARQPFVGVGVAYARDYLSITGKLLAATYAIFLPILLLGSRRYLLGLPLLALGLSMVSSSFVKLLPSSLRLASFMRSGGENVIYMYSSKGSIVGGEVAVGNESCLINVTAKLRAAGGGSVSSVSAGAWGRLLFSVNLSDPAVYELGIAVNGSGVRCSGEDVLINLRLTGSRAYYRLEHQLIYGLALTLLGLTASAIAYLGRAGSIAGRGMGSFLGNVSWHLRSNFLDMVSALLLPAYYLLYALVPASCKLGGLCLGRSVKQLALEASIMPSAVYLLASLHAVVAAALMFGYHIDSGLDRRLVLLGISRLRVLASKMLALALLVSASLAAARVGVYILVEPSAGSLHALALAALAYGASLALLFGGLSALASVLAGRPSYALLALIPAVVAISNTTPAGRPLTYESLAFKLLGVVEPGASLYGLAYLALAGAVINLMLALAYLRREL